MHWELSPGTPSPQNADRLFASTGWARNSPSHEITSRKVPKDTFGSARRYIRRTASLCTLSTRNDPRRNSSGAICQASQNIDPRSRYGVESSFRRRRSGAVITNNDARASRDWRS